MYFSSFEYSFCNNNMGVALGSGTDALHIAYILANINRGDEVAVPVFTCTATNIPLLYLGATPKFVDIDPLTMNVNVGHLEKVVNKKQKLLWLCTTEVYRATWMKLEKLQNTTISQ